MPPSDQRSAADRPTPEARATDIASNGNKASTTSLQSDVVMTPAHPESGAQFSLRVPKSTWDGQMVQPQDGPAQGPASKLPDGKKAFHTDRDWKIASNVSQKVATQNSKAQSPLEAKAALRPGWTQEGVEDQAHLAPAANNRSPRSVPKPSSSRSETAEESGSRTGPSPPLTSSQHPKASPEAQKDIPTGESTHREKTSSRAGSRPSDINSDQARALREPLTSSEQRSPAEVATRAPADSKKRMPERERSAQTQNANRFPTIEESGGTQRKQLKVEDALAYLEKVKIQFSDQLSVYNKFLDIMKEFKAQTIDTGEVITGVSGLFRGHKDLILGFNTFLPPGYNIRVTENAETGYLRAGFHGPNGFSELPQYRKITASKASSRAPKKGKPGSGGSPKRKDQKKSLAIPPVHVDPAHTPPGTEKIVDKGDKPAIRPNSSNANAKFPTANKNVLPRRPSGKSQLEDGPQILSAIQTPLGGKGDGTEARAHEFERAIGFVRTIKERFVDSPDTFNEFLDALSRFREEQKSIREVFEIVADLFGPHKDLLSQFKEFIPNIPAGVLPDTKNVRPRVAPQVPRRLPGGKSITQSTPNRRATNVNGKSRHRPRDMKFFEDLKTQLGAEKSHLYHEFIKCLSLFSQRIVSKEEMLHLTSEILKDDSQAQSSFMEYLETMAHNAEIILDEENDMSSSISSEEEPAVDAQRISYYTSKPMSEIAAEAGVEQKHSYRRMPPDFPALEFSGRSIQEGKTLNDTWINVTTGSEDYSFKFMRRNQNEDNLFRCEDDRYELDLVIETNASTIMKLETIVATISKLPLAEKKRHALAPGALSPIHFNAIQRIYGDRGPEAISQVKMNPSVSVPVVLRRLKEKDIQWRRARMDMNRLWRSVGERNYHRSLDHRSTHFKAVDKKDLSAKSLLLDILDPSASVAARDLEMTRARGYPVENGGGGANHRSIALKAVATAARNSTDLSPRILELPFHLLRIHKVVFDLLEGSIDDDNSRQCLKNFRRIISSFFGIAIASKGSSTPCTRLVDEEAEGGFMNVLYGDESIYLLVRLYHLLSERVFLALSLTKERVADFKRRKGLNEEGALGMTGDEHMSDMAMRAWELGKNINGQDSDSEFTLGPTTDNPDEIFEEFIDAASLFSKGKLDWSKYEDKCRVLLGVDSYCLFTFDKTLHKVAKAVDTVFANDSKSRELCELHHRCQSHLQESRKNGGKLDLSGMENVYCTAAARHVFEAGSGGSHLMRFQCKYDEGGRETCTLLIHVIGKTCDEELAKSRDYERVALDKFLGFCGCFSDCGRHFAGHGGEHTHHERRDGRDGGARLDGSRKRSIVGQDGAKVKKRRRGGIDFMRYVGDAQLAASRVLEMEMENGLKWKLDARGSMKFVEGTHDLLYNRSWTKLSNRCDGANEANERSIRTKRAREILKLNKEKCEDAVEDKEMEPAGKEEEGEDKMQEDGDVTEKDIGSDKATNQQAEDLTGENENRWESKMSDS